jgi:hypothetical protein
MSTPAAAHPDASARFTAVDAPFGREARGRSVPVEYGVLRTCARVHLGADDAERLRRSLDGTLDWERLLAAAERHRLVPLLYRQLHAVGAPGVPSPVLDALRERILSSSAEVLQLTRELLRVLALFAEHGIMAVPYKGPALAAQLYGSLALRHAGDLDLLVRPRDVARAGTLLRSLGYHPRFPVPPGGEAMLRKSWCHEVLDHDEAATVELHWGFTHGFFVLQLDLDALAPRLRRLELGGADVLAFSPNDLLLILCVHGSKHRWDRLEWVCGVAELLRSDTDLDLDAALDTAHSLGVRRMLLLGLILARDLLHAPLPPHLESRARSDRQVRWLATEAWRQIACEAAAARPRAGFFYRMMERPGDRARLVVHWLTAPVYPDELHPAPVGRRIVPLHALRRPVDRVNKLLALAVRSAGEMRPSLRRPREPSS